MARKENVRWSLGRPSAQHASNGKRPGLKKATTAALLSAMLVSGTLAVVTASEATAQGSISASEAENTNLWFVELSGAPEADGNSKDAVKGEKDAFKKAAASAGVKFKERRSFDVLFNGLAVEVTPSERAKLAMLPGFKAMYPIETIQAPKPDFGTGAAPDLASAITMTGANVAQANGVTGAGVRVAVMDTGIDIDHPDLGGTGVNGTTPFPSARVTHGYDLVGDAYNADSTSAAYNPVPSPDNNPDDCGGHGTHVAGIVGANGAVKGVAPGVTFGAYRVFGCAGSTTADIMIAAMEMALSDKMDVLNMSIGSGRQWPQYPTAQATERLVKKGMVVVASIGNNGPNGSSPDGIYAAGAPGVGASVIGVASFDNLQASQLAFQVNPGMTSVGYNIAGGAPPPPTSGTWPIATLPAVPPPAGGTPPTAGGIEGCPTGGAGGYPGAITWLGGSTFAPGSLVGKVLLVRRGSCGFHAKAWNAQQAGASAVILYNNAAGALNPTVAGTPPITIPVVAITQAAGTAIAGIPSPTVTWGPFSVTTPIASAGLISGFSSFGLAADLSIKPNLGAPGGQIFSTYPLELGGYANISGTSMSSPHVAGAAALLLQANPKLKPNEIKVALQNTAVPKNWTGNPGLGFLDNVHRQGAGLIDIPAAIATKDAVEPSEIALGESDAKQKKVKLKMKGDGKKAAKTYDLSHQPALATAPNNAAVIGSFVGQIGYFDAPATVSFSKATVKSDGDVDVTITAPDTLPDRGIYGGYILMTPQGGGQVLRVPYAGFKGDYQAMQVLAPTANGFPWLAQLVGTSYFNRPDGATYTLVGNDIPFFLLHLDHLSEEILLEALDTDGKVVGRVSIDEWVTRSSTATGFFAFSWDGELFKKDPSKAKQWSTAPNGTYTVRVTVKKALAEKDAKKNPGHYETWTSPAITLARP